VVSPRRVNAVVKRVVLFISNAVEIRVVLTPIAVFGSLANAVYSRDWASSFSVDCLVCSLIINYAK
jgi:hypothetical protein